MQQVLYTIVPDANFPDANFPAILATDGLTGTNLIQGSVSMGGFTYYITANTARPASSVYAMMLMPNGSFIMSQSKRPALVAPLQTFLGWAIPA